MSNPDSLFSPDPDLSNGAYVCPMKRVLAVNENGLVVEALRNFEVGSTFVLGCHVEAAKAVPEGRHGAFVAAEVIVVESQLRSMKRGSGDATSFQVTLLFSDISRDDRELLMALSDIGAIRLASAPGGRKSGLAIPPPQVFPLSGTPLIGDRAEEGDSGPDSAGRTQGYSLN